MRKLVWLIILSIMLVGCIPSRVSHRSNNSDSQQQLPVCDYQKLSGNEFILGPLNEYDQARYGYFHLYLQPDIDGLKLPYKENVNHHGRLTDDIIRYNNTAFRKAILDNCQIIYIAVNSDTPYKLGQIEKSGVYFISTQTRLNNIKNELEHYVDSVIYAKAPIGFLYLIGEDGQKEEIKHGTPLLVKDVVIDLRYKTVYMIVKHNNKYLHLAYDSGYYLTRPSYSDLKSDLWDKLQLITFFTDLVKNKMNDSFNSTQKMTGAEISSLYFPSHNGMYFYNKNANNHIVM